MKIFKIVEVLFKLRIRLRSKFVLVFKSKSFYNKFYISYWNYIFSTNNSIGFSLNYYSALPNPGAGIGHQIANWIAGYWFAKKFGLEYAHSPFSNLAWDSFLGFGENEITVDELIKGGYKKIRLPFFDELNAKEIDLHKKIISSYSNRNVIFIAEQDQVYKDQFGVMDTLSDKFYNSPSRVYDKLIFDTKFINIAIHVRRGDIGGRINDNPNFFLRWQGNEYFINVLRSVLDTAKTEKPIAIYLFSQGNVENFAEFNQFENLHYCLDMNPMDSFLHMVNAEILITSKSSFSYKPALINKGIKVCPKDFWHGYPKTNDWVLVDEKGYLLNKLKF